MAVKKPWPQPGLSAAEERARKPRQIRFAVRRTGGLYEGTIVLPIGFMSASERVRAKRAGGKVRTHKAEAKVTAKAKDKAGAIAQAAGLAEQIASNPLMAAALPPGTGAAVKALGLIAKKAPVGKLDSALKALTGDGAKRIASALKFW